LEQKSEQEMKRAFELPLKSPWRQACGRGVLHDEEKAG
jgi:hypothetical protein